MPEVGKIYEGKITGITKFGAFVEIEPNVSGMVHISEVSNTYVSEIKDHLTEGQVVKVKVIGISEEGKISLSIKKALPRPEGDRRKNNNHNYDNRKSNNNGGNDKGNYKPKGNYNKDNRNHNHKEQAPASPEDAFEAMMNHFKASSDERMGDIKRNMNNKRRDTSRKR